MTPEAPPVDAEGRPRARARRGEGSRLRDEILDAAEAILLESGTAEKVSTRAVAQRVGCSSPSIYLHFPDRASLLFAVCEREFDLLGGILHRAVEGLDDPIERIRALGIAYGTFALDNPQQYRVMMMDSFAGVVWEKGMDDMRAELGFDVLFDAVTDGIAAGVLAPVDPVRAAFTFWAVGHGIVSLVIAKPGVEWPDSRELLEFAITQAIDGLRVRPS